MRFSLSWQRRRKGGASVMLHTTEDCESRRIKAEVSEDGSGGERSAPRGHTCPFSMK